MAIDKESTGLPQVDLHRKTTKVNLSIIVAIGLFFLIAFGALYFFAHRSSDAENRPSPSTQEQTTGAPGEATRPRPANSGGSSAAPPPAKK